MERVRIKLQKIYIHSSYKPLDNHENKRLTILNGKITFERTIKELEKLPSREKQSPNQRKTFSEISAALLTTHLEYLIEERNWVAGIIMSASMLEFTGKTRLLWKQTGASKAEIRNIHRLEFASTIKKLLKQRIIAKSTHERMEEIRQARNEAAHDLPHQIGLSLKNEPNVAQENLIRNAVKIIKDLFSSTG